VKARDLANAYSQSLSMIFTQQMKPYEVEILVGEVDGSASGTAIYHVMFDGSVTDEHGFVAIGGHAEELTETLQTRYEGAWDLATAVKTAVEVIGSPENRTIEVESIEAGVLDRTREQRRKFRRLEDAEVAQILGS
jgi:proteasome alpha subunit